MSPEERASLSRWLTPAQMQLFERMHVADARHGLDVAAALRRSGVTDDDLLKAALFHDGGKGKRTRWVHRVGWSLGEAYGPWVWRLLSPLPTFAPALDRMRRHAEVSAALASAAGCSNRTAELIRCQATPVDEDGRMLAAADERN